MAVAVRKLNSDEYTAPITRVYSSTGAAAQTAEVEYADVEKTYVPATRINRDHANTSQTALPKTGAKRFFALMCITFIAAAAFFVIMRYAKITAEYRDINSLKDDIETCELSITALNVQLNSAVGLDEAREAAERAGMDYPTADQILTISRASGGETDPG